ncbi:RxLR effector protein [Phytophthora ramorum]|uniref:RxLR effector protein n=1 Tax=Phytophthora ramorum TaxID=164328 RepID=UPI003097037A|nr:RxLR effector protein [Phytophthora ramorum]
MRFAFVFLLVATTLLVSIDAVSRSMGSKVTTRGFPSVARSLTIDKKAPTTRLLRSNDDQDNDERAITAGGLIKQATDAQMLKVADSVRVRFWLRRGKTAEAVFKRLKLDKGVDEVLSNKNLATWFTYVKLYNNKHPDKRITITDMLTKTYGDEAMAKMLEIARDVPSKNRVADKMLTRMGYTWWRNEKSADDVFGLLNLDKAGVNVFQRREFNTWVTYSKFLSRDPEVVMIDILTQRLGADKLARIFATAKPQDPELKVLAVKLQTTMLKEWQRKGLTVEGVFALLKLDDGVEKILVNPALEMWMGYVNLLSFLSGGNSQAQLTTMVNTFTASFKTVPVARMLETAKKMENTKELATNLQKAQFRMWREKFKFPAVLSKMFNVNDEMDVAILRAYSAF